MKWRTQEMSCASYNRQHMKTTKLVRQTNINLTINVGESTGSLHFISIYRKSRKYEASILIT